MNIRREVAIAGTEARLIVLAGFDADAVDGITQQVLHQRDLPADVRARLAASVVRSHVTHFPAPAAENFTWTRLHGDSVLSVGRF